VLADAEVQGAAVRVRARQRVVRRQERGVLVDGGVVGARQVGRAAPQFGDDRAQRLQDLARGGAGGKRLAGLEGRQLVLPARGQLAGVDPLEGRGMLGLGGAPGGERLVPRAVRLAAAVADRPGVREDLVADVEVLVRVEAEDPLGGRDLLLASAEPCAASVFCACGPARR